MDKETFLTYFRIFTDENNQPVGKGDENGAWIALQYEESVVGASPELVCSRWKQYIEKCIEDKTPDRYVMTFESFIAKGKYKESFGASLKAKQSSFLDKYKDKPKPVENNTVKIVKYLVELPEGKLLMEFETKEQQNEFVGIIEQNNLLFAAQGFIVLQTSERIFEKKLLKYINEWVRNMKEI